MASKAKYAARSAAAKDAALAVGLDQRLADIESVLAADRAPRPARVKCPVVCIHLVTDVTCSRSA